MPARLGVGAVRRAHGVRGEVLVEVESDNPRRFESGGELFATPPGGSPRTLRIVASRAHRDGLLVRFDGIEDRDQAQELRGAVLEVDRSKAPPRPDGEVYFYQLVGCRCRDRTAGDLGEIVEVVEDGGGALLIAARGSQEVPIPFVARFITRLDLDAGELELDLPAGLVEACASES
ncbi:MAG: ribosome maturation factor RimM [Acidobacteriota bacterium]|nr:ribosome maturation factor RimM [Acidobacteriota bacterium]